MRKTTILLNANHKEFAEIIQQALAPLVMSIREQGGYIQALQHEVAVLSEMKQATDEEYLTVKDAQTLSKKKDTAFRDMMNEAGYFKTDAGYYRKSEVMKAMAGIKR